MTVGDGLLVIGGVLTTAWPWLNLAAHDGRHVRAVGRAVNAVTGVALRPLVRRLRESPTDRCRRLDHDRRWDNYFESCARCGASSRPEVHLPDARVAPGPLLRVAVDDERLRADIERLIEDRTREERRWPSSSIIGGRDRWLRPDEPRRVVRLNPPPRGRRHGWLD